jgi:hypothetical protein
MPMQSAANTGASFADKDPWDVDEARRSPDWEDWQKAMKEELDQLEETKTWELVKHKARLVTQGYSSSMLRTPLAQISCSQPSPLRNTRQARLPCSDGQVWFGTVVQT